MNKVSVDKDNFGVNCPFCGAISTWSLNLRWREQTDLVCPTCHQNISKVILQSALLFQKRRLQRSLFLTCLFIGLMIAICLFLVHNFANDLHQMPFLAVLTFSVAAICCSLSVAVAIVLLKQLLFLSKRLRLIKN